MKHSNQNTTNRAAMQDADTCSTTSTETSDNLAFSNKRIFTQPIARVLPALVLGFSMVLGTAGAAHADQRGHKHNKNGRQLSFTEYADVVHVQPIYTQIRVEKPERECWYEQQRHQTMYEGYNNSGHDRHHRSGNRNANPIIGGIIGGAIGNQLGRNAGSNQARLGATIAGVVIGSAIANESPRSNRRDRRRGYDRGHRNQSRHIQSKPVERCTTRTVVHTEDRLDGYYVTYRYRGSNYKLRTHKHPGQRIALKVNVRPQHR